MNVDTGQMGHLADVLRDASPGERVIPATIIPMRDNVPLDAAVRKQRAERYGPRKPLREVRAELQAAKATEAA